MDGECDYVFKRKDPKTWGPDKEYWRKCHEGYEKRKKLVEKRDEIKETKRARSKRGDDTEEVEREVASLKDQIQRLPPEDLPVLCDDKVFTEKPTDSDDEVFTEDIWACPHPEHNESGKCIFHLEPNEKEDVDESEAFLAALEQSAETGDPNFARFLGAHFGTIDISPQEGGLGADLPDGAIIDLSCSRFETLGSFSGNASTPFVVSVPFRAPIVSDSRFSVEHAHFEKPVFMGFSRFAGERPPGEMGEYSPARFQQTSFLSSSSFVHAEFRGERAGEFERAEFRGERAGDFRGAAFSDERSGDFERAEFCGEKAGDFERAEFHGERAGDFERVVFRGKRAGDFERAEFHDKRSGDFERAEFHGERAGDFERVEFRGERAGDFERAGFRGKRSGDFRGAEFSDERSGDFRGAEFSDEKAGIFRGTKFCGERSGDFRGAEFSDERVGYFQGAEFSGERAGDFGDAEFSGETAGDFEGTKFSNERAGDFEGAKFTGIRSGCFRKSKFRAEQTGCFKRVRFAGAYSGMFGNTDSNGEPLTPDEDAEVYATFTGQNAGDFTRAIVLGDHAGNFHNVHFVGKSSGTFTGAEFRRPNFTGVRYESLNNSETVSGNEVDEVQSDGGDTDSFVEGLVSFVDIRFEDADFADAKFERPVCFNDARFRGDTSFKDTTFEDLAAFEDASFGGATFQNARFEGETTFEDAIFTDNVTFVGTDDERPPRFGGESPLSFKRTEFRQRVNFSRCADLRGVSFCDATLSWADFTGVDLTDVDFTGADLTGSTLDGTTIENVRFENSVLESVNVGSETFRDGRGYVCCYDPTKTTSVDETANESQGTNRETSSPKRDSEVAATVYQKLEAVARANTLPRAVGQLFVARKRVERHQYFERMRDTDRSASERLYWFSLWTRSWAANLVLYYGESPWRIILTSASIVLLCAFLYPFGLMRPAGGSPIVYSTTPAHWIPAFFDGLYVSVLTFTTAGFGQYHPIGYGRLLSTAEATSGLVLFALLIFVFGRRATR